MNKRPRLTEALTTLSTLAKRYHNQDAIDILAEYNELKSDNPFLAGRLVIEVVSEFNMISSQRVKARARK